WYDPGVVGHGMGDTTRGRVYRLAPKGNKYQVPRVDLAKAEGIVDALASPNLAVRHMAIARFRQLPMKDGHEVWGHVFNLFFPDVGQRANHSCDPIVLRARAG